MFPYCELQKWLGTQESRGSTLSGFRAGSSKIGSQRKGMRHLKTCVGLPCEEECHQLLPSMARDDSPVLSLDWQNERPQLDCS